MEERWETDYRFAYIRERKPHGTCQLVIERQGVTTCLALYRGLEFKPHNKQLAIERGNYLVREFLDGNKPAPKPKPKLMQVLCIADAIQNYVIAQLRDASPAVKSKTKQALMYYFGNTNFSMADYAAIQNQVMERYHHNTYAPAQQHKQFIYTRKFLEWCVAAGFLQRNPFKLLKPPAIDRKPDTNKHLSYDDITNLIADVKTGDLETGLVFELMYETGMRPVEVCRLHWNDIDEKKMLIHGKGDKDRIFPLTPFPRVQAVLDQLKQFRDKNNGKVYRYKDRNMMHRYFSVGCQRLGINRELSDNSNESLYTFRRAFINRLEKEYSIDLETRCRLVGNSPAVQLKHYTTVPSVEDLEKKLLPK